MTLPYNTYFEQPHKLKFIDLQIRLTTFPVEAIIFHGFRSKEERAKMVSRRGCGLCIGTEGRGKIGGAGKIQATSIFWLCLGSEKLTHAVSEDGLHHLKESETNNGKNPSIL